MAKRLITQYAADFETLTGNDQPHESSSIVLTTFCQWQRGVSYLYKDVDYFINASYYPKKDKKAVYSPFWSMIKKMADDVNPRKNDLKNRAIVVIWFLNSKKFDGEYIKHELANANFVNDFNLKNNETFRILNLGQSGDILIEFIYNFVHFKIKDILAFTPMTLKQMGKIVGLDKLDFDLNRSLSNFTPTDWAKYLEYALVDTQILTKYLLLVDPEMQLKPEKITAPSATMQAFKGYLWGEIKRGNKEAISFKDNLKIPYSQWSKASYFGGYVSPNPNYLNKIVKTANIFYYDVNSEYPYVMTKNVAYQKIGESNQESRLVSTPKRTWLVHVLIKSAELKEGRQPILREIVNDHPTSTYIIGSADDYTRSLKTSTNYSFWVDEWEIIKQHYHLEYTFLKAEQFLTTNIFKKFIKKLYKKRQIAKQNYNKTGDMQYFVKQQHSKLLLNSLYGKFGQSPHQVTSYFSEVEYQKGDTLYIDNEEYVVKTKQLVKYGNYFSYKIIPTNHPDYAYNIYVASHITSMARCLLFSCINSIPHNCFLYSDTDSIITTTPILQNIGDELGQLKREYSEQNYRYFYSQRSKNYLLTNSLIINKSDKITISGMNDSSDLEGVNLLDLIKNGYTTSQKRAQTIQGGKLITSKMVSLIKQKTDVEIINVE